MCVLRALAEDENRAQRAQRGPDLALLDAVTWPDFLWDTLRVLGDPLGAYAAYTGAAAPAAHSGTVGVGADVAHAGEDAAEVCAAGSRAMLPPTDPLQSCQHHRERWRLDLPTQVGAPW